MLHSAGHMGRETNLAAGDDDHNNGAPNIMMSGTAKSNWLRAKLTSRTSHLWSSKLPYNLTTFRPRMLKNFGNEPARDNYNYNILNAKTQVGPVKEDGTF